MSAILVDKKLNPRAPHTADLGSTDAGHERASIDELSASIKNLGQLKPVIVERIPNKADQYRLRAGFRRYEAMRRAGMKEIEVKVYEGEKIDEVAFAENALRANFTSAEYAFCVRHLVMRGVNGTRRMKKTDREIQDAAKTMGIHPATAHRYMVIMMNVDRMILEHWRRSPGAFTVEKLLKISQLPKDEQVFWFHTRYEKTPDSERAKKIVAKLKDRKSKKNMRSLEASIRDGLYDRYGKEWKRGALDALAYCLRGREIKK